MKSKPTNGEIKIESGVPLPPHQARNAKYPFSAMQIGDSFFVPNVTVSSLAGCMAHARHRDAGRIYTSRTVEGGVRVWRTA
jgi:hypothetical protein